jgi:hypothetical protein
MADEPKRPRGRPRLKADEDSLSISLRLPTSTYDQAFAVATKHDVTVSEVFRRAFAVVTKHKLDEP